MTSDREDQIGDARFDALIEKSSLGTPGARRLRERVPRSEGEYIRQLAELLAVRRGWGAVEFGDAEARIAEQEAQLVAQLADGNIDEPMKELYRRYAKNLYRFGIHMLSDEGLAEEMVQETFQRLWRSAGRYNAEHGSVGAFLFVIARAAAADIRKRPSSRPLLSVEDFQPPPLPDSADQILDSLMLRDAFDKLTSPHAEVLRLSLEEGLTQSQIAERLHLPLGTVKTRMFHGTQALRSILYERGFNTA